MIPRPVPAEAPEQQVVPESRTDRPEQPAFPALQLAAAHSGRAEPRAPQLELPHRPAQRREPAQPPVQEQVLVRSPESAP